MKAIIIGLAIFGLSASAMAQTIPPIPSTTPLTAGMTVLRVTGGGLISAQAPVDTQFNISGGRGVIEAGVGPNGIVGNNPVKPRDLGTIQGKLP